VQRSPQRSGGSTLQQRHQSNEEDPMQLLYKTILCPFCGHPTHIALDISGDDQDDIEDCSNCCSPIHIVMHKDESRHSVQVFVDAEDEQFY